MKRQPSKSFGNDIAYDVLTREVDLLLKRRGFKPKPAQAHPASQGKVQNINRGKHWAG